MGFRVRRPVRKKVIVKLVRNRLVVASPRITLYYTPAGCRRIEGKNQIDGVNFHILSKQLLEIVENYPILQVSPVLGKSLYYVKFDTISFVLSNHIEKIIFHSKNGKLYARMDFSDYYQSVIITDLVDGTGDVEIDVSELCKDNDSMETGEVLHYMFFEKVYRAISTKLFDYFEMQPYVYAIEFDSEKREILASTMNSSEKYTKINFEKDLVRFDYQKVKKKSEIIGFKLAEILDFLLRDLFSLFDVAVEKSGNKLIYRFVSSFSNVGGAKNEWNVDVVLDQVNKWREISIFRKFNHLLSIYRNFVVLPPCDFIPLRREHIKIIDNFLENLRVLSASMMV